jgi:hypothetical protein
MARGVTAMKVMDKSGCRMVWEEQIAAVVRHIKLCRLSREEKDAIHEERKTIQKSDAKQRREKILDGMRADMERTSVKSWQKQKMGKHFKGQAVVNGLKGAS